jgi:hypothetical protein
LNHRAHSAVEDEDALAQELLNFVESHNKICGNLVLGTWGFAKFF